MMIKDILAANEKINAGDRDLAALREYFPECFKADGNFDVDRLAKKLKTKVNITREGYELNFLGKNYARLLSAVDTTSIVRPDAAHNALPENAASENIYISGDNLDALKLLLKSYAGTVKCIYIDPPYNTGSDGFVYNDKFKFSAAELETRLSIDPAQAQKILDMTTKQAASHSAWLTFMYPRLLLARDMLSDDGVIFISIDDNEQANLKLLCDELFGEENFVALFPWRSRTAKADVPFGVSNDVEWIIAFARTPAFFAGRSGNRKYYKSDDFHEAWRLQDLTKNTTRNERPNSYFVMTNPRDGKQYQPSETRTWSVTVDTFEDYYNRGKIVFPGDYDFLSIKRPAFRVFENEDKEKAKSKFGSEEVKMSISSYLSENIGRTEHGTKEIRGLFEQQVFSYPKPTTLISFFLEAINDSDALILDFFSGSATTAHAVLQLNAEDGGNRKYIMVQLPEQCKPDSEAARNGYKTIDQIGMERIRRAAGKIRTEHPDADIDCGFRHFTLCEPQENTLDKMEIFDPNGIIADATILDDFGRDAVLRTWAVRDGYGLTAAIEEINLAGYTAYLCGRHLYLLDENITYEAIEALIAKFENVGAFNPETIVLFGYSFGNWPLLETLRTNIRQLSSGEKNLSVNIITRY